MVHEEVSFKAESNKRFAGTCFFFQKSLCNRASNWSRDRTNKIYSQSKALSYSASECTAEQDTDKQAIGPGRVCFLTDRLQQGQPAKLTRPHITPWLVSLVSRTTTKIFLPNFGAMTPWRAQENLFKYLICVFAIP